MNRTRDPETMTVAERRDEVAAILARGIVRCVRSSRTRTSDVSPKPLKATGGGLEVCSPSRLSVAPRPRG